MSAFTKFAGFVAGISAVAAVSVAVAQGVPPNPLVTNPAQGAGQQAKTHLRDGSVAFTPMGETGVLASPDLLQSYATLHRESTVAAVAQPEPQPAEPAAAAPAPAPEPVAQAPAPAPEVNSAQTMGAPAEEPKMAKADRN